MKVYNEAFERQKLVNVAYKLVWEIQGKAEEYYEKYNRKPDRVVLSYRELDLLKFALAEQGFNKVEDFSEIEEYVFMDMKVVLQ